MLSGAVRVGSSDRRRYRCFAAGMATLALAFLSPLEGLSAHLASAHMVQHVLIFLVAAPFLTLSAPSGLWRWLLPPVAVWLLHAATVWFWHAAGPYDAALRSEFVHLVEHGTLLVTALLFWWVIIGNSERRRVSHGFGVLLVFAMAMQSVFLSVLLTFARTPWYSAYATTTRARHLDPLADQQLAGVIMWIPAGLVYLGVGLALAVAWLREAERAEIVNDAASSSNRTTGGVP